MSVKGRMMCPVCEVPLSMTERQGIEIDFCPDCRGVWLDRGELDKIIERSAPDVAPQRVPEPRGYNDDRLPARKTRRRRRQARLSPQILASRVVRLRPAVASLPVALKALR